jgi:formylglycine-generating enzyme required for sulfatase activity
VALFSILIPSAGLWSPEARGQGADRQPLLGRIRRDASTGMEFVKLLPGELMMGCSAGDKECLDPEKPAHRVRITKAFEIGRYEVTQAQWQSVMGSNPSIFKGSNLPVEGVSWNDVQDFLQRLNANQDG